MFIENLFGKTNIFLIELCKFYDKLFINKYFSSVIAYSPLSLVSMAISKIGSLFAIENVFKRYFVIYFMLLFF